MTTSSTVPPGADGALSARTGKRALLRSVILKLSSTVKLGAYKRDRLMVKNARCGTYLNVSKAEMAVLEEFRKGTTVPRVLSKLILSGEAPPFKEFYELVEKAADQQILVNQSGDPPPATAPVEYRVLLPASLAIALIAGVAAFFLYANLTTEIVLAETWHFHVAGYLLISAGLSAGYLLAGGVLRAYGAEVYTPRWEWKTPVPHFRFDLRDARMVHGNCEALAGLLRLTPLLLFQAVASFQAPALSPMLILGILWQALPLQGYPISQFLNGITNRVPSDVHRHLVFDEYRRDWHGFKRRIRSESKRFVLLAFIYTSAWIAGALYLGVLVFSIRSPESAPEIAIPVFFLTVAATLLLIAAGYGIRAWFGNWRTALRNRRHRRARRKETEAKLAPYSPENPPYSEKLYEMLSDSTVFGEIQPEDRKLISKKLQSHFFKRNQVIVEEKGENNRMYFVFKGEVEVLRQLSSGRLMPLATLGHSDVFGKVPLWDSTPNRLRTIRSLTPVILYSLSGNDFSNTVISKESHIAIRNAVKVSFLSRLDFFQEWPRERLRSFARMGSFVSAPRDTYVIRQNQHNQFFYIVYDGISEAIVDRRRGATLRIGDFFGEISILRNAWAMADVFAREDSRYLVFSRNDFVQFLSQYPEIALAFETICSKRLGKPVYPVE